jgi:hypothetical protein
MADAIVSIDSCSFLSTPDISGLKNKGTYFTFRWVIWVYLNDSVKDFLKFLEEIYFECFKVLY